MKRLMSLTLALLMLLLLAAGCAPAEQTPPDGGADNPAETPADTPDEGGEEAPMQILWSINNQGTGTVPDKEGSVVRAIEEKFNVELSFFDCEYIHDAEKWNLKISSGEIPEVWYDHGWSKWYDQGIIRPITEEMIAESMPFMYNEIILKQDPDKKALKARTLEDGTLMGVPSVTMAGASCFLHVYRQDWLDKLGLGLPSTLDDLEKVLRAFTFDDPDGNGQDDTYGLNLQPNPVTVGDVFGAYGVEPNLWMEQDGKVVYANVTDGYRDALKRLAAWYAEGLVNPEFITDTFETLTSRFADGQVGSYYLNYRWASTAYEDSPVSILLAKNADAKVSSGDAVTGPDGKSGAFGYGPDLGWAVVFRHDLSDEKVARCMQILDWLQTGEGAVLNVAGVEGANFEYDEFSKPRSLLTPEGQIKQGINAFPMMFGEETITLNIGKEGPLYDFFMQGVEQPWISNAIGSSALVKSTEANIGADLSGMFSKYFLDAMSGKVDVDASWDAYVEQAYSAGLTEWTAEANEIYEAMYK